MRDPWGARSRQRQGAPPTQDSRQDPFEKGHPRRRPGERASGCPRKTLGADHEPVVQPWGAGWSENSSPPAPLPDPSSTASPPEVRPPRRSSAPAPHLPGGGSRPSTACPPPPGTGPPRRPGACGRRRQLLRPASDSSIPSSGSRTSSRASPRSTGPTLPRGSSDTAPRNSLPPSGPPNHRRRLPRSKQDHGCGCPRGSPGFPSQPLSHRFSSSLRHPSCRASLSAVEESCCCVAPILNTNDGLSRRTQCGFPRQDLEGPPPRCRPRQVRGLLRGASMRARKRSF